MIRSFALLLCLLCGFGQPAAAREPLGPRPDTLEHVPWQEDIEGCLQIYEEWFSNNTWMMECLGRLLPGERQRMEAALQALERGESAPRRRESRRIQAAWEHFMQRQCRFMYRLDRSLHAIMASGFCELQALIARRQQLEALKGI